MHKPDPATPIEETLAALTDLVTEGKVRYVGSSNFAGWQVVDADWTARSGGLRAVHLGAERVLAAQPRASRPSSCRRCERTGQGLLPFFPLASGLLTGKYRRGEPAPDGTQAGQVPERLAAADFDTIEALAVLRRRARTDHAAGRVRRTGGQPPVTSVIAGATIRRSDPRQRCRGRWVPTAEDLGAPDLTVRPS